MFVLRIHFKPVVAKTYHIRWKPGTEATYPPLNLLTITKDGDDWQIADLPITDPSTDYDYIITAVCSPNSIASDYTGIVAGACIPASITASLLNTFQVQATGITSINNFNFTSSITTYVNWGDGVVTTYPPALPYTSASHTYATPYTGPIKLLSTDLSQISRFSIGGTNTILPLGIHILVTTEEIAKLTRLDFAATGLQGNLTGIVSDLPRTLTSFSTQNNTLSGDTLDFPRGLTILGVSGSNIITGDVNNLPSGLTVLIFFGQNTLFGDIATLPRGITILYLSGSTSVTGNIVNLPPNLTLVEIIGSNTVFGDTSALPRNLTHIAIHGANYISGDLAGLPDGVLYLSIIGANTISGTVADIKAACTIFEVSGTNTIEGDLALVPADVNLFVLASPYSTIGPYTGGTKTWPSVMNKLRIIALNSIISSADIDEILIEMNEQVSTWIGDKSIVILVGVAQNRTSASNTAVVSLQSKGVTVRTVI